MNEEEKKERRERTKGVTADVMPRQRVCIGCITQQRGRLILAGEGSRKGGGVVSWKGAEIPRGGSEGKNGVTLGVTFFL